MRLDKWAKEGLSRVKKVHFIGVGGSGMCGLAEILHGLGYKVSGSDINDSAVLQRLANMGIKTYVGHRASQVEQADLVVRSSAVGDKNVEIVAAEELNIAIAQRAEMLAEIMRFGFGIAIAGSHGKTTTTSIMAKILAAGGEDVTFIVGGLVKSSKTNAKLGSGKYIVAEADESDASFLYLQPAISIITNIDREHMAMYDNDFEAVKNIFVQFIHRLPFYGLAVICVDDENVRDIEHKLGRPFVTYGFSNDANYRAINVKQSGMLTEFDVIIPTKKKHHLTLNALGKHNVLNALACIATAVELGMEFNDICAGISGFSGVSRRQDYLGDFSGFNNGRTIENVMLIDDYGHHPKEIEVVLEAIRAAWPNRRVVVIFQPHRYSRTRELYNEFIRVLSAADVLLLLDVYSAGEEIIPGSDSKNLASSIRQFGKLDPIYIENKDELPQILGRVLLSDDILVTQGAGDIGILAQDLSDNSLYLSQV